MVGTLRFAHPTESDLLPRHRLPADVAAAKTFRPSDLVDRRIGALLGFGDCLADSANVEHTSAIAENVRSIGLGAGMKDLDAFDLRRLVQALDEKTLAVVAGVSLGCHDHRQRHV